MPVAVLMPHQKQENRQPEKDPLDVIIKGLNIASQIYGFKEASDKAKVLQEQKAADAERYERDWEFKNKQDANAENWRQKNYELEKQKANTPKEKDPLAQEMLRSRIEDSMARRKAEFEKASFDKTSDGRMAKLGAAEKQRLDNAKQGLSAAMGMSKAFNNGDNTFSLIGDNDFTQQRAQYEEALGRMQSGGAISTAEENRFKKMAPTPFDSKEMQQKKLMQIQNEMASRLNTLGFKPQEVGLNFSPETFSEGDVKKLAGGGLSDTVNALKGAPKAKTIIQNGHTYILNEKTGQYE